MSMRNMVAMFGAMAVLRRIDQEEPLVLLYSRMAYLVYAGVTAFLYALLHFRIVSRRDLTQITVPISEKAPSFSEAMEKARKSAEKAEEEKRLELEAADAEKSSIATDTTTTETETSGAGVGNNDNTDDSEKKDEEAEAAKTETITIMEYDLRHLANARKSWASSALFLALVHYKMESVSPLVMAALMGIIRLFTEEPLVQIHLRGAPAVDKLARPFTPEKNPLATMFKDMASKDTTSTTSTTGRIENGQAPATPEDDLHDDGDEDEEDDNTPAQPSTIRDDIKSDFDDEEPTAVSEQGKKMQ